MHIDWHDPRNARLPDQHQRDPSEEASQPKWFLHVFLKRTQHPTTSSPITKATAAAQQHTARVAHAAACKPAADVGALLFDTLHLRPLLSSPPEGLCARRVAGAAVGAALLVAWGGSKQWCQHVPALCTKLRRHRAARKKQARGAALCRTSLLAPSLLTARGWAAPAGVCADGGPCL